MRIRPLLFATALVITACSADSAPDNAAGSIKKAPSGDAINKVDVEGVISPADSGGDIQEAKKKKKVPNSNGPKCGDVVAENCPDPSRQNTCSCNGPMNQPDVYNCGCKEDSGSKIKTPEFEGAGG